MKVTRKPKRELQEASKIMVRAMFDSGYIAERDARDLLHRLETGDRAAYSDTQELLLSMAAEYNGMT